MFLRWLVVDGKPVHDDQMVVKSAASVITAVKKMEYNNNLESNNACVGLLKIMVGCVQLCCVFVVYVHLCTVYYLP